MDLSTFRNLRVREEGLKNNLKFERQIHCNHYLISRLGLEHELEGHTGCVNCLEWSTDGSSLISGSDDVKINVWDAVGHRKLKSLESGHEGNIFSVKYIPGSENSLVASGAADCKVRALDIVRDSERLFCNCHRSRVKRLATCPNSPSMFWSSSEDGLILEYDLRSRHVCSSAPTNCLVNLSCHMGVTAEAKCISINPQRCEMMAVGANDPYVRVFDRRMISNCPRRAEPNSDYQRNTASFTEPLENQPILSSSCASYFVPGHLPPSNPDLKSKFRSLTCTYVAFSPDGSELLANLGGEQIYLYDVLKPSPQKAFCINFNKNGFCSESNLTFDANGKNPSGGPDLSLPKCVNEIKIQANINFEMKRYSRAINLYNVAIDMFPQGAVLYGNRAAAFVRRGWDGDLYMALRDCYKALSIEHDYLKVHFKLVRILLGLRWFKEATIAFESLKKRYPEFVDGSSGRSLEKDIIAATSKPAQKPDSLDIKDDEGDSSSSSEQAEDYTWPHHPSSARFLSEEEKIWRARAYDFKKRFCGHCNTTTDIKEANFFGRDGQFIVAGSDDGSFFIWDKKTTNIVRVLKGDDSIVNCLQPHPSICLLASSGIDPVVRLWSPRPEDGSADERLVKNAEDAANANQQRMNSSPFEAMLMSMGYRELASMANRRRPLNEEQQEPVIPCRAS